MDEEMVESVREAFEGGEIDMDYEFDAPRFYDFTRPKTGREAEEADEWFLSAGGYQPSLLNPLAFLEKLLNLQKGIHPEPVKNSTEPKDVEEVDSNNCMEAEVSVVVDDNIRELPNHMALDTPSAKPKSTGKSPLLSRSSTLMKPTASQLAEQNHRREIRSNRLLRRVAKKLRKLDEKSQNSPPPTKRHKLEAGYVRKVAEQLKHQHLWLHKVSKKFFCGVVQVGADAARPKVTIRRNQIWKQQIEHKDLLHDFGKIFCLVCEGLPNEHITLIFRYKVNAKPGEQSKILRAPPWPSPKKLTIPATEFQVIIEHCTVFPWTVFAKERNLGKSALVRQRDSDETTIHNT